MKLYKNSGITSKGASKLAELYAFVPRHTMAYMLGFGELCFPEPESELFHKGITRGMVMINKSMPM